MPSEVPIRCMAAYTEEAEQGGSGLVPLFVGRDDGTVERFDAMQDAELGIPSVVFFAHRRPVTGIVASSATELHTCSLDGTMKQWTLAEAVQESMQAGGTRVRASRVKTTFFPFGVSVMVQDNGNRLLLGGEDGSLTLMEGERRSTWRAHDGGAVTAIAVDREGSNAVLTGSTDGTIFIWDMEFGRPVCELRGHTGPVRLLSFVPVPAAIPVVRQKRSPDGTEVKEVLVRGNSEEGTGATCILSCAADGTVKVWLLPDLHEANAEAELLERQQQQLLQSPENAVGAQRRSVGISFQEPTVKVLTEAEGGKDHRDGDELVGEGSGGEVVESERSRDGQDTDPGMKDTIDTEESTAAVVNGFMPELDPKEQFLRQQVNAPAFKSAIKAPERRVVPSQAALGTVELPQKPFSFAIPSSSSSMGGGGGDEEGPAGPSLLFIGAAKGDVYGLRTRRLVKDVCLHAAQNFQKVQQEVLQVQKTLKDGIRVYTKTAAAKMKAEEATQLAIAAKAKRERLEEERAARKREVEARRAARRRPAEDAEDEEEGDREEEEEEEEEETEDPFDKSDAEDEENAQEEEEEEGGEEHEAEAHEVSGDGDSRNPKKPRRPASWKRLSPEQRVALETFCAAQEAERDAKIAALRTAVDAHVAQVKPLTKTAYHRSRAQFENLSHTTSGHIHRGTAVTAMAAASLVATYADKVFVAQMNVIVPVTVAFGLMKL